MTALILDTETNDLEGYPIEIAYLPSSLVNGELHVHDHLSYDEYFSCPKPIALGAMAVHHILESYIAHKPSFDTFRLPEGTAFIIGHNVDYDIRAIQKCDSSIKVKAICTLALARSLFPELDRHTLTALYYHFAGQTVATRKELRNAHNARADVGFTATILHHIIKKTGAKSFDELYLLSENARVPTVMTFGKYKGTAIKDIPSDYKAWLLKQSDLDQYLKKALTK